jgi:eukaryotic-like serine/threonine-protein kinase
VSLSNGTRLGPYEILSPIGAGGMGEVYKARDTRLGREVAVKVLPAEFAQDPERLHRFEQEARAAAALNHPNILVLFDIGSAVLSSRGAEGPEAISSHTPGLPRPQGGLAVTEESGEPVHYIVTELLEGESLRQRLRSGPLPPAKAVEFGIQIAQGLSAAHGKGIVHRDLKPENLFLTKDGRVKILDFGLAQLRLAVEGSPAQSQAPTSDSPTREGKVLGTPGYMSPEQVRGKDVDQRTDLFAFGVVLYEMLAGKGAFAGGTAADTQAAILTKDPDPLPSVTPAGLDRVVRRCLEKRPEDRFSSAHDVAFALEAVSGSKPALSTPAEEARSRRSRRWIVMAGALGALLLVAAALLVSLYLGREIKKPSRPFEHFKVSRLTQDARTGPWAAISPDGRYVTYFVGDDKGRMGLWVQKVATSSAVQVVPPTEGLICNPTFSPDGSYVYYCSSPPTGNRNVARLFRVPILGGPPEPQAIEDLDTAPTFSPDGKRLAFLRNNYEAQRELRISNTDGTGQKVLVTTTTLCSAPLARPAWSPDGGTIAWVREEGTRYFLQLVDVRTGAMRALGEKTWDGAKDVEWLPNGRGLLLVARNASLSAEPQIWLVEYPSGAAYPLTNDVGGYSTVGVSSDGKTLVSVRVETRSNIWVAPIEDPAKAIQITSNSLNADGSGGLAWTPSGGLAYTSKAGGKPDLWILEKLGSQARRLTDDPSPETTPAVSPDGRTIVFSATLPGVGRVIWRIDADGSNRRQISPGSWDWGPVFTKDGRWVIYTDTDLLRPRRISLEGGPPEPLGGGDPSKAKLFDRLLTGSLSCDGLSIAGWVWDQRGTYLSVAPLDGNGPRIDLAATTADALRAAVWAAGCQGLLYVAGTGGDIWRVGLDKTPPRRVTDLKGERVFQLAVSADRKQLAYARGQHSCDIVLIQQTEGK